MSFYVRGDGEGVPHGDPPTVSQATGNGWVVCELPEFGCERNVVDTAPFPGAMADSQLAPLLEWSLLPNANGTSLTQLAAAGHIDFVSWWESLQIKGTAPKQSRHQLWPDKDPQCFDVLRRVFPD